jgi:hypothetical protein
MAHPQPSPPGGVPPQHHGHLAAHAQVNGHIPVQSQGQKGPHLNTAQKIATLNEQVWLQIGKYSRELSLSLSNRHANTNLTNRQRHRVDGRARRRHGRL